MKGATVLFSEMIPDIDWEDEFNEWYETHHLPARMKLPGFVSAQRYREPERSNHLAVYELESAEVLAGEAYRKVESQPNAKTRWMFDNVTGFSRYLGDEISDQRRKGAGDAVLDAPILFPVFFSVPDDRADEFNAWYTEEHVPMLLACEHWLAVRRFEISDGEPQPWTHLALHYLGDVAALDSPEREAARNTEWHKRLAAEPWFRASFQVFERGGARIHAAA